MSTSSRRLVSKGKNSLKSGPRKSSSRGSASSDGLHSIIVNNLEGNLVLEDADDSQGESENGQDWDAPDDIEAQESDLQGIPSERPSVCVCVCVCVCVFVL